MKNKSETWLKNLNPRIDKLKPDILYHLGLQSNTKKLRKTFEDVIHVAMMGSAPRAFRFADSLAQATNGKIVSLSPEPTQDFDVMSAANEQLQAVLDGKAELLSTMQTVQEWVAREIKAPQIIGKDERYWMFAVDTPAGKVISVNHHMGQPTHSILLHEITKMLHHAGADRKKDRRFEYSRLGTSGGLGIEGGDIVISTEGLEPSGKARYRLHVLGEEIELPTQFDPAMAERIFECRDAIENTVVKGGTVSGNDFYTEQARLDGAFALVGSEKEKIAYLTKLHDQHGARNFEMEAAGFAAFCEHMGISAACICVALLNRLNGDQVTASAEQLAAYSDAPQKLLIEYIKRQCEAVK